MSFILGLLGIVVGAVVGSTLSILIVVSIALAIYVKWLRNTDIQTSMLILKMDVYLLKMKDTRSFPAANALKNIYIVFVLLFSRSG